MSNIEYLGKIGYRNGNPMQGLIIYTSSEKDMNDKKIVLVGVGENSFYMESFLKEKGIEIFAYADNSKKLQGGYLRGKKIYSPFELFNCDEYYFIITVHSNNINRVRLQFMTHGIKNYGIFLNTTFHDFLDEDKRIQEALLESINMICFDNEEVESALPYCYGTEWKPARLEHLFWSTQWSNWAYLWSKELVEHYQYKHIMEVGPGYGLMSLTLLKQFRDICIDWILLKRDDAVVANNNREFEGGLQKIKNAFSDRTRDIYCSLERDDLPEKKYDLIILTEVFEHFALNPVDTMKKLMNILADNGRIILSTPNWGHTNIYQTWEEMPHSEDVSDVEYNSLLKCGHAYQYDKVELFDVFVRAGFDVEEYAMSDANNHNVILIKCRCVEERKVC